MMPDLKDLNNIYMITAFLVPGIIITYMRSRFVTGRMEKMTDATLGYFVITIIYYGFSVPIINWIIGFDPGIIKTLIWWGLIVAGPFACGLLLGIATQREWLRWLATKLRLRMVHNTPTSWDWRFSICEKARFILVTLNDGSLIAGIFGADSFASTDPSERDIYIQEIMDVDDEGRWLYTTAPAGILILAKEIRYIEFKEEL